MIPPPRTASSTDWFTMPTASRCEATPCVRIAVSPTHNCRVAALFTREFLLRCLRLNLLFPRIVKRSVCAFATCYRYVIVRRHIFSTVSTPAVLTVCRHVVQFPWLSSVQSITV